MIMLKIVCVLYFAAIILGGCRAGAGNRNTYRWDARSRQLGGLKPLPAAPPRKALPSDAAVIAGILALFLALVFAALVCL